MRKTITFLALFIVSATVSSGQPAHGDEAARMIRFTNAVIDISNAYNGKYRDYAEFILGCAELYENYPDNYDPDRGLAIPAVPQTVTASHFHEYEKAGSAIPDSVAGRASIVNAVDTAVRVTRALDGTCRKMERYFAESRFLEDGFEGFDRELSMAADLYEAMRQRWIIALEAAKREGEKAETLLLEGSPMAPFVIPMKQDLNALSSLIRDIFTTDAGPSDYARFVERNEALRSSIEKNRSTDDKDTSLLDDPDSFASFYTRMFNATGALGAYMDEMAKPNPDPESIDRFVDEINTWYAAVIRHYNNF